MENEVLLQEAHTTDWGRVEIAPEVIQIIAGLAVIQVPGVARTSGNLVSDMSQLLGRKNPKQGIKVELNEDSAHVTARVIVQYGHALPKVGKEVQESVKSAIESMTGISVTTVTVRITEVKLAPENEGATKEASLPSRLK